MSCNSSRHERSTSGPIGCVHLGAVPEQRFNDLRSPMERCRHECRDTILRPSPNICSAGEELFHDISMPSSGGLHQCCGAILGPGLYVCSVAEDLGHCGGSSHFARENQEWEPHVVLDCLFKTLRRPA